MSEVENNLERLKSNKGVKCIITVSNNGDPINIVMNDNDMEESEAKQLARMGYLMSTNTRAVIDQYNKSENLQVLRVRMNDNEITIVPEEKYSLIVVSDPKKT